MLDKIVDVNESTLYQRFNGDYSAQIIRYNDIVIYNTINVESVTSCTELTAFVEHIIILIYKNTNHFNYLLDQHSRSMKLNLNATNNIKIKEITEDKKNDPVFELKQQNAVWLN